MSESDTLWLVGRIAHDLWMSSDDDQPPSEEVEEIVTRINELKRHEKISLLRALVQ
ncbi:hypothetical protein [Calothrix sp. NIES-2098]|uniref:hypothetical protein n=1 Tax=Calothrix sp. NIES-2098 TaxID=1954171 RepID=UPI0030DD489B